MKLLILSDIHGNLSALNAVLSGSQNGNFDAAALLGDHIDYGMRPNEVIAALGNLPFRIGVNIWGNHEKAVMDGDLSRFSSERGRDFSKFTGKLLNDNSRDYIKNAMNPAGFEIKEYGGKRFLFVHGSIRDFFWNSISPEDFAGGYSEYDYVVSGHSHIPHYFEKLYKSDDPAFRGTKKTVFINPGSIGQPRNHNPRASYAVLDTGSGAFSFQNAPYDISAEQELYAGEVDEFYKTRLERGI